MTGTPRSVADLDTLFATAGPDGGIVPQNVQDLAHSMVPWDDPLKTPYLLRGTITAYNYPGVTIGTGGNSTSRTATGTALNAAIADAANNGKFFEIMPNIYEINNSGGLVTPPGTRLTWRGTRASEIRQYATNAPILTIGDVTGATVTNQTDIEGLFLDYYTSQTSQTAAIALRIGFTAQSSLTKVTVGNTFNGYVGVQDSAGSFSDTWDDWLIKSGQQHVIQVVAGGSGNTMRNIYCAPGGLNAAVAVAGYVFGFDVGCINGTMELINIEAAKANVIMQLGTCRSLSIKSLHMETITFTGSNPTAIQGFTSRLNIVGATLDFRLNTSDSASGTGCFLATFGDDTIVTDSIELVAQSTDSASVNLPFQYVNINGSADSPETVRGRGIKVDDFIASGLGTHFFMDSNMPLADFPTATTVGEYVMAVDNSYTRGDIVPISATMTHFGARKDCTYLIPAAFAANITITLSPKWKNGGAGQNMPPDTNSWTKIRVQAGTIAHTVTIVDGVSSGTIGTISTAATDIKARWNGTNYVAFT